MDRMVVYPYLLLFFLVDMDLVIILVRCSNFYPYPDRFIYEKGFGWILSDPLSPLDSWQGKGEGEGERKGGRGREEERARTLSSPSQAVGGYLCFESPKFFADFT